MIISATVGDINSAELSEQQLLVQPAEVGSTVTLNELQYEIITGSSIDISDSINISIVH